jgi:tight adherence protein B
MMGICVAGLLLALAIAIVPIEPAARLRAEALLRSGRFGGSDSADIPRLDSGRRTSDGSAMRVRPMVLARLRRSGRLGVSASEEARREEAQIRAVRLLCQELEAGAAPSGAWAGAAAIAADSAAQFQAAAAAASAGEDAGLALRTATAKSDPLGSGDAALQRLGSAWSASAALGASGAAVLERWLDDMDARARGRDALAAALAGPRASAAMIAGLPIVGIGLGSAMGAQPLRVLTGSGIGIALGSLGAAFELAGLLWVRQIIRAAQRA